ncbi:MAG TPA: hypothetical protein VMY69_08070, partial [Phycisphaerae bacterium]|nr:hypothetical protein [Phycisphaerae bacterium]
MPNTGAGIPDMIPLSERAEMALDALRMKPTKGIPQWHIFLMGIPEIEHFAGRQAGSYHKDVEGTYIEFQRRIGTCFLDQYIPDNPLSMDGSGLAGHERGVTTGADTIILDGIRIDSPEAVVEHLERFAFPNLERAMATTDPDATAAPFLAGEQSTQRKFGPDILKVPYGCLRLPFLRYGQYGYVPYFTAFALYPKVMEKDFRLQADVAEKFNPAIVRAIHDGGCPAVVRLDCDMADSRGPMVDVQVLDRLWFPNFERAIRPAVQGGI